MATTSKNHVYPGTWEKLLSVLSNPVVYSIMLTAGTLLILPIKSIAKGLLNTFLVYSYITNRRISIPSVKLNTPKEGTSTPSTLKSSNYFKPILNITF
jgi:hypothetical protein